MSNPRDPDMQEKPAARAASIGCTGQMNSVQIIVCVFIVSVCSACLVGCGDDGDTAAVTFKPQAGKIMNWSQIDSSIAVPTDAPVLQIDGGNSMRIDGTWENIYIVGDRSLEFDYLKDRVTLIPSNDAEVLAPNLPTLIKAGERKVVLWRAMDDPPELKRLFIVNSLGPGAFVKSMDAEGGVGGGLVMTRAENRAKDPKVGDVLYWKEHRSQTDELVGFDLAFACDDRSLLSVLPGDVPSGRITWTPFHCDRYDCGYPRSDVSNTTSYSAVTQKPGGDMSKSGSRPDCAVWTSERDGKAIVYVSMRCRNTPLPYELMFVEFSPTPALDPGELAVIRNIQIRLPKSPVTTPGFRASEFEPRIPSK